MKGRKRKLLFCPGIILLVLMLGAAAWSVGGLQVLGQDEEDQPHIKVDKDVEPYPVFEGEPATITLTVTGAGQPTETRVPLDIVLIIDTSASMDEGGKIAAAKGAAKSFVDTLDPSTDRIALVSFGTTAVLELSLTGDFDAADTAIDALTTSGFTNIADAISLANNELISSGRPQTSPNNTIWVSILLTDGLPNRFSVCSGLSPCTGSEFCDEAATCARNMAGQGRDAGITLFTIGLGGDVNEEFLDDAPAADHTTYLYDGLAFIGGGLYYFAPSVNNLEAIFEQISIEINSTAGRDVRIIDLLPDGVHFQPGTAVPPPDSDDGSLIWNLGDIDIGETVVVSFNVIFDSSGYQLADEYPGSMVTYIDHLGNQSSESFPERAVTVESHAPTVDMLTLYDSSRSTIVTAMDPGIEYALMVAATDIDGLSDLSTVAVILYYDNDTGSAGIPPVSGSSNGTAILTCQVGPSPTWTIEPANDTSWELLAANCEQPDLGGTSGHFWFHFKPGKVAAATDDTHDWDIHAVATDVSGESGAASDYGKQMNPYVEITLEQADVYFGTIAVGESVANIDLVARCVSNSDYDIEVRSDPVWSGEENSLTLVSGSPGRRQLNLRADDDATKSGAIDVTGNYQPIRSSGPGPTADNTGDPLNCGLWLALGSADIPADIYSGLIYYRIVNHTPGGSG